MNSMLSFAAAACFLTAFLSQQPEVKQSIEGKYPLEVILILTPDQCSAESKKGNWVTGKEKFPVGELLCSTAGSVVEKVFEKHTRIEAPLEKGIAPGKVILSVRFVDLEGTTTVTAFGKRKMVLLIEWTATDESGKVFWAQTVEGSAEEKAGNAFTLAKHRRKMLESAKQDLTEKSVLAMRQSPEFRKLAQRAR